MIAKPLSRKTILKIAKMVRDILKNYINEFGRLDIVRVIEYEIQEMGFNYEIVELNKMPNEYATTDIHRKLVKIREDVYEAVSNGDNRHRFTLAHELGHILLHQDIRMARSNEEIKKYCDPEWQADEFASWLLCPVENNNLNISEISARYGVSKVVAEFQLKKLKEIK